MRAPPSAPRAAPPTTPGPPKKTAAARISPSWGRSQFAAWPTPHKHRDPAPASRRSDLRWERCTATRTPARRATWPRNGANAPHPKSTRQKCTERWCGKRSSKIPIDGPDAMSPGKKRATSGQNAIFDSPEFREQFLIVCYFRSSRTMYLGGKPVRIRNTIPTG